MRPGIHPEYSKVLFHDSATAEEWVGFSTMKPDERKAVDGEELPLIRLDISAKSHPFWTGQSRTVDAEGRIDRFKRRYARKPKAEPEVAAAPAAAKPAAAKKAPAAAKKAPAAAKKASADKAPAAAKKK
jgi:large subunit ribosomal protein L31